MLILLDLSYKIAYLYISNNILFWGVMYSLSVMYTITLDTYNHRHTLNWQDMKSIHKVDTDLYKHVL